MNSLDVLDTYRIYAPSALAHNGRVSDNDIVIRRQGKRDAKSERRSACSREPTTGSPYLFKKELLSTTVKVASLPIATYTETFQTDGRVGRQDIGKGCDVIAGN